MPGILNIFSAISIIQMEWEQFYYCEYCWIALLMIATVKCKATQTVNLQPNYLVYPPASNVADLGFVWYLLNRRWSFDCAPNKSEIFRRMFAQTRLYTAHIDKFDPVICALKSCSEEIKKCEIWIKANRPHSWKTSFCFISYLIYPWTYLRSLWNYFHC